MRNKTVLEDLDAKISLILEKYTLLKDENLSLQEENERLKSDFNLLKDAFQAKNQEIEKLQEEDELKDLELEDITHKISKAMGLVTEQEEDVA
jgi:predicted  nucleic acid-binding Zn-ribbon protein